jgi:hypothetical protein
MKISVLKWQTLWVLLLGVVMISCNKEETISEDQLDEFTEETVFRIQESGNMGRFGCYELVFDITLVFPDGSEVIVADYDEMKEALKTWKRENPRSRVLPTIKFPYEVVSEDGEVIVVENREDQLELRRGCLKKFFENHGPKGHNGRPELCFTLEFPVSVKLPNQTIVTFENPRAMAEFLRNWRKQNRPSNARPELVFPVTVKLEDGTTQVVNSKEELKELKESCD